MPSYLYSCSVHKEFEIQQSIKDSPINICPQCIEEKLTTFKCKDCNAKWKHSDKIDSSKCKKCDKKNIEQNPPKPKRLISPSNFVLVGGGWAKDNYK